MLDFNEVLEVHERLITEFGGFLGVRDKTLLSSSLARPFQTFDSNELYLTIEEKASAILESIIGNHPFIDGNKRTGYALFRLLLLSENKQIKANLNKTYEFVISVAEGNMNYDQILSWTRMHVEPAS